MAIGGHGSAPAAQGPGDQHEGDQDAGDGQLAAQPGPGGGGRRVGQAEQGQGGGQQAADQVGRAAAGEVPADVDGAGEQLAAGAGIGQVDERGQDGAEQAQPGHHRHPVPQAGPAGGQPDGVQGGQRPHVDLDQEAARPAAGRPAGGGLAGGPGWPRPGPAAAARRRGPTWRRTGAPSGSSRSAAAASAGPHPWPGRPAGRGPAARWRPARPRPGPAWTAPPR